MIILSEVGPKGLEVFIDGVIAAGEFLETVHDGTTRTGLLGPQVGTPQLTPTQGIVDWVIGEDPANLPETLDLPVPDRAGLVRSFGQIGGPNTLGQGDPGGLDGMDHLLGLEIFRHGGREAIGQAALLRRQAGSVAIHPFEELSVGFWELDLTLQLLGCALPHPGQQGDDEGAGPEVAGSSRLNHKTLDGA